MIGAAPAQRYNVSLPPDVAEAMRKAGGGNLSAGIRLAAAALGRTCPRPRCDGTMLPGLAMAQTYGGAPDFPGGAVVTMSPSGPGKLTSCLKCSACGYSVSA